MGDRNDNAPPSFVIELYPFFKQMFFRYVDQIDQDGRLIFKGDWPGIE
jgi:hypothetical protein